MGFNSKTHDVFLAGISLVYMFAFGSIYIQIPGEFLIQVCCEIIEIFLFNFKSNGNKQNSNVFVSSLD